MKPFFATVYPLLMAGSFFLAFPLWAATTVERNSADRHAKNLDPIVFSTKPQFDRYQHRQHRSESTIRQDSNQIAVVDRILNPIIDRFQKTYTQTINWYQQSIEELQRLGQVKDLADRLNQLGLIYHHLGQHDLALEFYQKTLDLRDKIDDDRKIGKILNNLGLIYQERGDFQKALELYQQALVLGEEIGDRSGISHTLHNLGLLYHELGDHNRALELLNQSLDIAKEIGDRVSQADLLNSLGTTYKKIGDSERAKAYYFAALDMYQQISEFSRSRITWSHLGDLFLQEQQRDLAILFYKQAIDLTEQARKKVQDLSLEPQQYKKTISQTYRNLANLLLEEVRIVEAQQILDLLKVQELDNYLRTIAGTAETVRGIEWLPMEKDLLNFMFKDRPDGENFNRFIRSPEFMNRLEELQTTTKGENLDIKNFNRLQQRIKQVSNKAVIFYPMVFKDRLELLLVSGDRPPISHSVSVTKPELEQEIKNFRVALTNPIEKTRIQVAYKSGKKLYDWLIKPIERELDSLEVDTIIYAPDGQLRYIPLAALYDGDRWLIEKFQINNITAASLTHLEPQTLDKIQLFAGAFTEGNYQFNVGQQQLNLSGLEFARKEIENIVSKIPNTTTVFNQTFNQETIVPQQLNQYNIVHLATHAAFIDGRPEESFILLGDGHRITLRDLETWSLPNVQLMVLSACQTAVGDFLGNGQEILGLGYQMQKAGVQATIASLWNVDDRATHILMTEFYRQFSKGNVTKVQALRQAQLSLITNRELHQKNPRLKHPYYWSSFILIGNGF